MDEPTTDAERPSGGSASGRLLLAALVVLALSAWVLGQQDSRLRQLSHSLSALRDEHDALYLRWQDRLSNTRLKVPVTDAKYILGARSPRCVSWENGDTFVAPKDTGAAGEGEG